MKPRGEFEYSSGDFILVSAVPIAYNLGTKTLKK